MRNMKKKIIIVAILCVLGSFAGALIRSEVAEAKKETAKKETAKVTCTTTGDGAISEKECAEKLFKVKSIKNTCTSTNTEVAKGCKTAVKERLLPKCNQKKEKEKKDCTNKKDEYYKVVKSEIDSLYEAEKADSDKTDSDKKDDESKDSKDSDDSGSSLNPINEGECTSLLPNSWCDKSSSKGITNVAGLIVGILTGMVLTAGTIGLIICGYIWLTAQDNAAKVEMAKKRMLDIVIGLVAWVLLAALANLIIPQTEEDINSNYNGGSSSSSGGDTEK